MSHIGRGFRHLTGIECAPCRQPRPLHPQIPFRSLLGGVPRRRRALRSFCGAGSRSTGACCGRCSTRAAGPHCPARARTSGGTRTPEAFPHGSVIIPAHNEAAVIARTLAPLAPLAATGQLEVIVACNGCSDNTAGIAGQFEGVTVLELEQPSKTAALNAGDAAASHWPRLYLDADVQISPGAVRAVLNALLSGQVLSRPSCRALRSSRRAPADPLVLPHTSASAGGPQRTMGRRCVRPVPRGAPAIPAVPRSDRG